MKIKENGAMVVDTRDREKELDNIINKLTDIQLKVLPHTAVSLENMKNSEKKFMVNLMKNPDKSNSGNYPSPLVSPTTSQ